MRFYVSARARLGLALVCSSLASIGLYVAGALSNQSAEFGYLIWNLFLAWLPLLFALWLVRSLQHNVWSSWLVLLITFLWLAFLPNSFYMISDFIHIREIQRVDILFDVVMLASFIFNGVILGLMSLYLVHHELTQRVSKRFSAILIAIVLFLCSFAIYIGRDLRWNTWDILINPAGILVDISNHVLNPGAYPKTAATTISFFILLSSVYVITWYIARNLRQQKP